MKKIILSLLSCLFMSLCFAQNEDVLTQDLQEILKQKNNELIDINIYFKSQMPAEHLTHLNAKSDSKEVRREIVINELKKFSEQQQESVMAVIEAEAKNGNVTDINAHWLVNSINCKASRDVVYQLASHPDIKVMGLNKEDVVTEGYDEKDAAPTRGTIASHVTHIQAEKVWDLGYTGKGVTVAVLDSGCNLDHVDIKDHLWTGNANGGYNFVNPGQRPMDNKGHGSHCAGIVCGDGTSGVSTGIAPDATLMVLKVNDTGATEFDVMVDAIEYAVENGADIISISIGWWAPEASRKETFRSLFENALQANVVVAAAAGNNRESLATYPAPNNINSPADCPPPYLHKDQTLEGGVSAVISVGGVDEDNNIIGVSSQGPVTWANTTYGDYPYNPGIGLIRPDIVAQGASVKSLAHNSNTDHAIKGGTSMAAPAVAGVMALMLEKNPDLTPAELCRIIEETATPLSQTKSNDFGSGCINALAAVQAVSFDVQSAYLNKYNYTRNFNTGTNQNLELTLVNNGAAATSGATTVTLTSNDSNVTVANGSATISNTIAVNGTATCNFTINVSNLSPDNHVAKLTVTTSGDSSSSFEIEINISNELVAPSNITTQVQNLRDINLSWEATNNATSYNVYRDGSYIANTASTSYSDAGLEYGTLYTYTITTKRNELESESSREIRVQTGDNPEAPSPTSVTVANNNTVSWTNSTGSKSSNVYRKESSSEEVLQLASKVNGNSYTDNDWNPLPNGIYQYGVSNNHASEENIYKQDFTDLILTTSTSIYEAMNAYWYQYKEGGNGNTNNWSITTYSTTTANNTTTTFDAYMGNAAFIKSQVNKPEYLNYLVSRQMNYTQYAGSNVKLSFYYITPAWGNDVNTLKVMVSTDSYTGTWTEIWSSNEQDVSEWTKAEVILSNYIDQTFYIAFVNVAGYGYCTGLDEVSINVEGSKESRIEWSGNIYKGVNVFAQDGDMNNGNNWATNSTPSVSDNVIIDANAVINGTVEVNSLTINEGKSLTLNRGAKLIVNNEFNNNDPTALIINDGAQVVHNNENLPATFNMDIVGPENWSTSNTTGWQFIASPVKNAKINDFIPESSDYDLYRYDGTKNLEWINHKDENDYGDDDEPETPVIIDTVTIGEGTISKIAAPIYNVDDTPIYSLSQQIYTNEEIGCDGGTIKSVAFHQAAGNNNMRDIVVYLQNVDKTSYASTTDWITFSDADIVYQGTFDFGKVGEWVTIELQNAFAYTGNNLVITVYDRTGTGFGYDYEKCDKFYYSQIDEWRGMYTTSSAEMNLSSLSSGTMMKTSNYETPKNVYYLNNIKLGIACIGSNETTAPDAPQNLVANAISSSAISLSWNSVKKATSYNIYEGEETVATNITEKTYTVNGLTAETEYCFTVIAVNEVGESEKSEEACATTLKDIPAAPVVTATAISSTQIQLSWETVAGATWYNVYSAGHNFGPIIETSFIMEYLEVNTYCCFDVSAANVAGESAKTTACATTLNAKPIKPYDFTATATGESTIELSWDPANRATSYNVYQGDEKIATVTDTTTTVEGLEPETEYCFTVTAENEMGESDKTDETCATTNEKAPTIVEIGTESDCTDPNPICLPVYDYSKYSISQQIYTSSEIALGNGTIRSVSFKVGDRGNAATRQYEVYLKNITASSFQETGYNYFELSSSDKVYDGAVAVGGKQEWFTINFTTPFEYTGGNVVLCVYDKTGTSLPNGDYHNFYKYAAPGRSLYNNGNNPTYNPTTLATSASGYAPPYVNLIRFGIVPSEVVVPVAPTLSATATSSSEISLTWNLVPGATSYNVYKDDEQIATGLTETTLNVEDLDAETEYCFTVTAVNTAGVSAKSGEECVTTESVAPAICLVEFVLGDTWGDGWSSNKLTVSYGNTSEDLTFIVANNSVKEYSKEYILEIPTGSHVTVTYTPANVQYPYADENSFIIRYQDGDEIHTMNAGSLSETYTCEFDVDCTPTAPNAPELTATANSSSSISLTWDAVSKATSYNVYQSSTLITSGLTETSYTVEGLEAGEEYCFTVTAVNEVGESERTNVCVLTYPAVPQNLVATANETTITLTWNAVTGAESYNVYSGTETVATGLTEATFTTEELAAGNYCYTVTAVNASGESAASAEACATIAEQGGETPDPEGDVCTIELILSDKYSDGWDGSTLTVSATDGTSEVLTLENNGKKSETYSVEIVSGSHVTITYHPSSGYYVYPAENSFVVRYQSGLEIYSVAENTLIKGEDHVYEFDVDCAPKAPESPVVKAKATETTIVLTWDAVIGAESYKVYRDAEQLAEGLTETTYTITGLTPETEYTFSVIAANEVGNSEPTVITAKTKSDNLEVVTIEIGEDSGLSTTYSPVYDYYKSYSVSQTIYTSNEIGITSGTITSISYKNYSGNNNTRNIAVYLKNVDRNNFATKEWETLTSDLCVYDGSFTFGTNDWVTIELTNTFEYDGRNLLVCIVDKTGSSLYSSYDTFSVYEVSQTESESRAVYGEYKSYGTPINPLDLTNTASTPTYVRTFLEGTYSYRAPLVKFEIEVNTNANSRSATREVSSVSPSRGVFESAFQQGVGYLASYESENTAVFQGNLNHEKSYNFPVSYNSEKDLANFHLLGNPFSFNMKWSKVVSDKMATGYAVVNEQGGYTYYTDGEIEVGDGFFVKAIAENPSFSYNEEQRSRDIESLNINVVVNGNAGSDNVIINLADAGEEGFPKFKNFNEEIATIFVKKNGKSYGVFNCDKDVNEIPLYFKANEMGRYNINIEANGIFENITLVDLVSGGETNMLVHDYNFTASSQENTKRFILRFVEKQQTTDNSNFVYQSGEELIVNTQGTVQIIDVMGRVVYSNVVLNESERINISGFTTGTYIVRVIGESEVMTQKIVVY